MRPAQKLAVLIFCAILLIGFIYLWSPELNLMRPAAPQASKASEPAAGTAPKITIVDYGYATGQQGLVPFQSVQFVSSGMSGASVESYFFASKPQSQVLLLDYPAIDADDYPSFASAFLQELSNYGVKARHAKLTNSTRLSDSIIVAPNGAYPQVLALFEKRLLGSGNSIIFVGPDASLQLSQDGSIIQPQTPGSGPFALLSSNAQPSRLELGGIQALALQVPALPAQSANMGSQSGYFVWVNGTINTLGGPRRAAGVLSSLAIHQPWQNQRVYSRMEFSGSASQAKIMFLPKLPQAPNIVQQAAGGQAYLHSVATFGSDGGLKKGAVWDLPLQQPPGAVAIRERAFPNEILQASFRFYANNSKPVLLDLTYSLVSAQGEVSRVSAGKGQVKQVLFGSAAINAPGVPGDYLVVLSDQYGRRLGNGRLHVSNMSISTLPVAQNVFVLNATVDSLPVDSYVTVWKEGSNAKGTYPLSNGISTISARLEPGNNAFYASLLGQTRRFEVLAPQNPQNLAYLAVFGAVFLATAFYFGSKKKKDKITIYLPEGDAENTSGGQKRHVMQVGFKELRRAFAVGARKLGFSQQLPVLSAFEARLALCSSLARGKTLRSTQSNVESLLGHFVLAKKAACHLGYYCICPKKFSQRNFEGLVAQRIARDGLVAHGRACRQKGRLLEIGKTALASPHQCIDKLGILAGKYKKIIIVFSQENELAKFAEEYGIGFGPKASFDAAAKTSASAKTDAGAKTTGAKQGRPGHFALSKQAKSILSRQAKIARRLFIQGRLHLALAARAWELC
ncbi:hypothetical protein FJZ26_01735 [Candidatus Parvarchaeota archaeon]|nr:hypothetical protein [Candidatus Parvarchaeota archaeon]